MSSPAVPRRPRSQVHPFIYLLHLQSPELGCGTGGSGEGGSTAEEEGEEGEEDGEGGADAKKKKKRKKKAVKGPAKPDIDVDDDGTGEAHLETGQMGKGRMDAGEPEGGGGDDDGFQPVAKRKNRPRRV